MQYVQDVIQFQTLTLNIRWGIDAYNKPRFVVVPIASRNHVSIVFIFLYDIILNSKYLHAIYVCMTV